MENPTETLESEQSETADPESQLSQHELAELLAALRGLRAVRSRELERHADTVVRRVARALETPKDQWPQPAPTHTTVPSAGLVELLQAVLRLRAEEAFVAPSLLATHADLQLLVQRHAEGDASGVPILQGWRRSIAGSDLVALLEGRASVTWDPRSRRIDVSIVEATGSGSTAAGK